MDFLNNKKIRAIFKIIATLAILLKVVEWAGLTSIALAEWPAGILALLAALLVYSAWSVTETFLSHEGITRLVKRALDAVFFVAIGAGIVYFYTAASGTLGLAGWQLFEHSVRVAMFVFITAYAFAPQGKIRTLLHRAMGPVFWLMALSFVFKSGSVLLTNTIFDSGAYSNILMPVFLVLFGLFSVLIALKLAQKWMFSRSGEEFQNMKSTIRWYKEAS